MQEQDGIAPADITDRTYAALERKAVAMAGSAEGVILDATYGSAAHRKSLIAQAERLDIPVLFIECAASPEEVRRRLEARQECAESVSDATWEIYERQRETFESLREKHEEHHRIVETDRPVDHALREIDDFLRPG